MPAPLKKPNFESQFLTSVTEELHALRFFARFHWRMIVLMVLAIGVFLYEVRPIPPQEISIATGQPNSGYSELGDWYQAYFARHGIQLNLVQTNGSVDNNQLLSEGKVDAAFSQGGVPIPAPDQMVSLGSVEYEPLWLFYRGEKIPESGSLNFLKSKRVSIGAVGSGTRQMVLDLLREHSLDVAGHDNFLAMDPQDSVDALLSGKIDALFFCTVIESKRLWTLLNDPDIHIWDFKTSKAISSKLGYANPVVFPIGSISLNPIEPAQNIDLVATHTKILVNKDLHPAIQYLFMMAGDSYYQHTDIYFNRPGGFPAFIDNDVEKSEVAVKYLRSESTFLQRTFPFWVASFLDRAWLLIAALLAIIYPLIKMVPNYRNLHFYSDMTDRYMEMKAIDAAIVQSASRSALIEIEADLQNIDMKVSEMWVPVSALDRYYIMMNALNNLRRRLDAAIDRCKD